MKSRKLKIAVVVVAVVGILVLVFSSSLSIPGLNSVPRFKLPIGDPFGGIAAGLSSLLNPFPKGTSFSFKLDSGVEPLAGQSFSLENAVLDVRGTFLSDLTVGQQRQQILGDNGSIQIPTFKGRVSFDGTGVIYVDGETDRIIVNDDISIVPVERTFAVKVYILPYSYSVSPIVQNRLALNGVYGEITRFGETSGKEELANATVEISGFVGNALLDEKHSVSGSAVEIKFKSVKWG